MDTGQYGAVFAAAFAVQQATEFCDSLIISLWKKFDDKNARDLTLKKTIDKTVAVLFSWLLTAGSNGQVNILRGLVDHPWYVYVPCTIFVISAGTDGVNSVLKYLTYSKEKQKTNAADLRAKADPDALKQISHT